MMVSFAWKFEVKRVNFQDGHLIDLEMLHHKFPK